VETPDLLEFLANWNKDSVQPAWKSVPPKHRNGLAVILKLPEGETLDSFFGDEIGVNQRFIKYMYRLVESRRDMKLL